MSDATPLLDVLIVGAGISGLTTAHELSNRSATQPQKVCPKICLTEAKDQVGGSIITRRAAGFQWEEGPNSFSPTAELLKLAIAVGLKDQLIFADSKLPRFVYWQGRLMPVPMSPQAAIATPLLSLGGKLRALQGILGFVRPPMAAEESIAKFIDRTLGSEVLERLVAPFVSGVYAGDPLKLSMAAAFRRITTLEQNYGGFLAGAILSRRNQPKPVIDPSIPKTRPGELGSFKQGLQALPQAIAKALSAKQVDIKLGWQLQTLTYDPEPGIYTATYLTPEGLQQLNSRQVVLTTPAYLTAKLLCDLAPAASQALAEIPYPAVAAVALAYPQSEFLPELGNLRGFGNLIPRGQGVRTLGTIWASSLFSDRAPQDWNLLLNFIGGTTDPAIALLPDEEIVAAVDRDLHKTLLRSSSQVAPQVLGVKLWQQAIPQYGFGHLSRIQTLETELKHLPGLFVSSNYLNGVALGDCIKQAQHTASLM